MLRVGLAIVEKVLNQYASSINPTLDKPATLEKIYKSFPELNNFLVGQSSYLKEITKIPGVTYALTEFDWVSFAEELSSKNNLLYDDREGPCKRDDIFIGPPVKWDWQGRLPNQPGLEVFLSINKDNPQWND